MESWEEFKEEFKRNKIASGGYDTAIVRSKTGREYVVSDYEISGKNVRFANLFYDGRKVGRLRLQDIEGVF